MDEEKQGWDKIAEQERKQRQVKKASRLGSGLWFTVELIVGGAFIIIAIIALVIWLGGG